MRPALTSALALALASGLAVVGASRSARAADAVTPAACVAANEEAGPLRRAGKLREARTKLRLCSAQSCPVAVRKDCVAGAAQTDNDVPTVAFSVQDQAGNDLSAVQVSLDGQPLASQLDGKALDVDPGEHLFRFEASGEPAVEKRLVIVEGEKNRRERVLVGEPKVVPVVVAPPVKVVVAPPPPPHTQRTAGLILGGGGLVVAGTGAVFALVATLQWNAAKNACGATFPLSCADASSANADRTSSLRAGYATDALLAVGGAAFVTGVALVLLAPTPSQTAPASARLSLSPLLGPETGGFTLRGAF